MEPNSGVGSSVMTMRIAELPDTTEKWESETCAIIHHRASVGWKMGDHGRGE